MVNVDPQIFVATPILLVIGFRSLQAIFTGMALVIAGLLGLAAAAAGAYFVYGPYFV